MVYMGRFTYTRVEKCHTFVIKKQASKAIQYQAVIIISAKRVPPIKDDHSFNYLGKQFNFNMDCELIKIEVLSEIEEYLKHEILSTGIFYLVQNLEKSDTFWQICLTDTFGWRKIA